MLDHIVRNLVHPATASGRDYMGAAAWKTARRLVTRDGGLGLLARRSLRWHHGWWELPLLDRQVERPWPKFAQDRTEGHLTLSFLDTPSLLREESRRMDHCVGSMVRYCELGYVHIATVTRKGPDGGVHPSSTVDVRYGQGEDVVVRQHLAHRNTEPPVEDVDFVGRWLRDVNQKLVSVDRSRLADRTKKPPSVFGLPPEGTPADWKGILAPEFVSMDWPDLVSAIVGLHSRLTPNDAMPSDCR